MIKGTCGASVSDACDNILSSRLRCGSGVDCHYGTLVSYPMFYPRNIFTWVCSQLNIKTPIITNNKSNSRNRHIILSAFPRTQISWQCLLGVKKQIIWTDHSYSRRPQGWYDKLFCVYADVFAKRQTFWHVEIRDNVSISLSSRIPDGLPFFFFYIFIL